MPLSRTPSFPLAVALVLLATPGCERPANTPPAPPPQSSDVGRYQVVNGVPSMARNIMLLDTKTGKTWVVCASKDPTVYTETNWCAMRFFGGTPNP